MREELDSILTWIGEATLTNNEWANIEAKLPDVPVAKDKYQALFLILSARSGVGDATEKLRAYFESKGMLDIQDPKVNFNNISIGVALE